MYVMTKTEITAELTKNGYRPFMETAVGSVTAAEAWTGSPTGKPLVILLYRKDTGEIVDLDNLPEEEENVPDISAFVDDFRESVFRL